MTQPPADSVEIGYLRDVQMRDHADGVTAVVLAGDRGTAEVLISDGSTTDNEYAALEEAATEHVRECVAELSRAFAAEQGDEDDAKPLGSDGTDADDGR